jgi:hypothetical protein
MKERSPEGKVKILSLPYLTDEEFDAWKLRRELERRRKIALGDFVPECLTEEEEYPEWRELCNWGQKGQSAEQLLEKEKWKREIEKEKWKRGRNHPTYIPDRQQ